MRDFKKGGFKGGFKDKGRGGRDGGYVGKRRDFGERSGGFREEKRMYEAVCSECGNSCEVPFRPTGERPVLCDNCFGSYKNHGEQNFKQQTRRSNDRQNNFAKPERAADPRIEELQRNVEELHSSVNDILEKINEIQTQLKA